ncbi:MAG: hypothetical protein ACI4TT_00120 [Christensenellales bacterium]
MQPNLFDLLGENNPFKEQKANDYIWQLKDLENIPKNNKSVFSCFACGGGQPWVIN